MMDIRVKPAYNFFFSVTLVLDTKDHYNSARVCQKITKKGGCPPSFCYQTPKPDSDEFRRSLFGAFPLLFGALNTLPSVLS